MRRGDRFGVTLIELLVVMGIVGILFALFFPAINGAREAARRLECANRLHQLGVAIHSYHTDHGVFPPGGYAWSVFPSFFSPHAMLLPYLERRELYNHLNFDLGLRDGELEARTLGQSTAMREKVSTFLCPSDPQTGRLIPGNSFRACVGQPHQGTTRYYDYGGAFFLFGPVPVGQFTDGLSQTALMSERIMGDDLAEIYTPSRDVWFTFDPDGLPNTYTSDRFQARCSAPPILLPTHESRIGKYWTIASLRHTHYNHAFTPNSSTPDCARDGFQVQGEGVVNARSFHPGGVNLLFGDGRVRFVADGVTLEVWRALGTRNKGEQIYVQF